MWEYVCNGKGAVWKLKQGEGLPVVDSPGKHSRISIDRYLLAAKQRRSIAQHEVLGIDYIFDPSSEGAKQSFFSVAPTGL